MLIGAGYIGSALAPALLARDHEVAIIDTFWFGYRLPVPATASLAATRANASALQARDFNGYDAAIFLAGLSNDPMAAFAPHLNYQYNAALPAYLAHEARAAGVSTFIHAGSCSVYGYDKNVTESTPPKTFSPYGTSKLMGEIGCLQQGQDPDAFRVVAFRMGTVCGPSPRMRFDLIINAMVKDAFFKNEISVHDGSAERPILDLRDAVGAYIYAVENSHVAGVYNLVSENSAVYDIADKVQRAKAMLGAASPSMKLLGGKEIRSYSASNEKALRNGFAFKHSIQSTINSVVDWVMRNEFDPDADEFYNIKTFAKLNLA